MGVSDCQKYFALKYHHRLAQQKQYLVEDGLFSENRNPNYLGEILLYAGFALMTGPRLEVVLMLAGIWLVVLGTFMANKDASLQKKPGWESYSKRTYLLFFKWRVCARS